MLQSEIIKAYHHGVQATVVLVQGLLSQISIFIAIVER